MRYAPVCLLLLVSAFPALAAEPSFTPEPDPVGRDVMHQVSTLDALMRGGFDGEVTAGELVRFGDLGLGAVDRLDGELVVLNGEAWRIGVDGLPHRLDPLTKVPFAVVTHFDSDVAFPVVDAPSPAALAAQLDSRLLTLNYFYAIRIHAFFRKLRLRSVPAQTPPYTTLADAIANQVTWDLENVSGTIVGWRCPDAVGTLNVVGYHFHFLSDDRKHGGHVLDLDLGSGTAELDTTRDFFISLPRNDRYRNTYFPPFQP